LRAARKLTLEDCCTSDLQSSNDGLLMSDAKHQYMGYCHQLGARHEDLHVSYGRLGWKMLARKEVRGEDDSPHLHL